MTKLVNEVYHMYNRHQYPFVALNIAVASGELVGCSYFLKKNKNKKTSLQTLCTVCERSCAVSFRVCGCERHPGQTADFRSGGETLAGSFKELAHQRV